MRGCGGLDGTPLHASTDPRRPAPGVDLETVQGAGAEEDRVIDTAGRAVAGCLRDHLPVRAAREFHHVGGILGIGDRDDTRNRLRHCEIPRLDRLVESRITGQQHTSTDRATQFLDTHCYVLARCCCCV